MPSDISKDIERLRFLQKEAAALYSIAYQIHDKLLKPEKTPSGEYVVPPFPDLLHQVGKSMDELQTLKNEIGQEIRRLEEAP